MDYAVNCSILLTNVPLLERPQAAAAAGFRAVEFWWPFESPTPSGEDVDAFVRAVDDAGVELVALNFFAGDMAAGDRGVFCVPELRSVLRDSVDIAASIGQRLGCRVFNALHGIELSDMPQEAQQDCVLQNLAMAASAVGESGGSVVVEPLSGVDGYPLRTASQVVDIIDTLEGKGVDNVRLLADLYHLATNGDDVDDVLAVHAARIGHVQIADSPGRGAPGTGALPLREWLTQLEESGYGGHVGLEYQHLGPADPFAWLSAEPSARVDE